MKTKILLTFAFIAFGFIVIGSGSKVFAGSCTYVGPNAGTWTAGVNWSGTCAGISGTPTTGDDVTIAGNTSTVNDMVSISLNSLNFTGSPGGTLTGTDISITDSITSSFPHIIDVQIILASPNVSVSTNAYNGGIDLDGNNLIAAPSVLPWGISGVVTGPGTITMTNSQDVYLSGGASGTITMNASGTTRVSLAGSGWSSSSVVNLSNGAMFFGEGGTINSIVGDGTAIIRPTDEDGTTTNILGIDNALIVGSGDTLSFRVAGTTAGTNYDQIFVDNTFDINNATLSLSLAYTPAASDTYVLVEAGSIVGTFNGLVDGSRIDIGGQSFIIDYSATEVTLSAVGGLIEFFVTNFQSTPTNPTAGQPMTVSAVLGSNFQMPTGTAELFDGSTSLGSVTVVSGTVTFNLPGGLTQGAHNLTIQYSGDLVHSAAITDPLVVNVAAGLADTGINLPTTLMSLTLLFTLFGIFIFKKYES